MGSGIVKNLLNSGHNVTVWNRTTEKVGQYSHFLAVLRIRIRIRIRIRTTEKVGGIFTLSSARVLCRSTDMEFNTLPTDLVRIFKNGSWIRIPDLIEFFLFINDCFRFADNLYSEVKPAQK
jgi:hypothetical protein